jgi:hypothetical protein
MEAKQVKFSIGVVSEEIDKMLADGVNRHLFYRIVKGDRFVLEHQLMDVIADLQDKYSGRAWVSRSPEGIVIDRINS